MLKKRPCGQVTLQGLLKRAHLLLKKTAVAQGDRDQALILDVLEDLQRASVVVLRFLHLLTLMLEHAQVRQI